MSFSSRSYSIPTVSRAASVLAKNATGSTVNKGAVVQISSADIDLIDPSVEADVDAVAGVVKENIPDTESGEVVVSGIIENISGGFGFGAIIYLSKTGVLTDTKPSVGVGGFVSGDWIVKVGVIVKNAATPAQKDLLVNVQTIGQL